jgi:hypothetical protein
MRQRERMCLRRAASGIWLTHCSAWVWGKDDYVRLAHLRFGQLLTLSSRLDELTYSRPLAFKLPRKKSKPAI